MRLSFRKLRNINPTIMAGIILGIGGLVFSVGGHLQQYGDFNYNQLKLDFYANAATELISIAVTA